MKSINNRRWTETEFEAALHGQKLKGSRPIIEDEFTDEQKATLDKALELAKQRKAGKNGRQ